jgi:plasmid replication initiation protein
MKSEDSPLVTQDNRVVEAAYKLTLAEQRLILLVLTKIDTHPDKPAALPETLIEVTAADVIAQFGLSDGKEYLSLKSAADRIAERWLFIEGAADRTRWVSRVKYMPNEGRVVLRLAADILPYLTQLRRSFTSYRLLHVAGMTSVYAIRLYELLVQWARTGERTVALDWLRERFQIEGQYGSIRDLKRRVIDPAVAQINAHSDLDVTYVNKKRGRDVVALVFTFGPKVKPEPKPEAQPKAAVRRRGSALQADVIPAAQPSEFVPPKLQPRTPAQHAKAREALNAAKKAARGA